MRGAPYTPRSFFIAKTKNCQERRAGSAERASKSPSQAGKSTGTFPCGLASLKGLRPKAPTLQCAQGFCFRRRFLWCKRGTLERVRNSFSWTSFCITAGWQKDKGRRTPSARRQTLAFCRKRLCGNGQAKRHQFIPLRLRFQPRTNAHTPQTLNLWRIHLRRIIRTAALPKAKPNASALVLAHNTAIGPFFFLARASPAHSLAPCTQTSTPSL